MKNHSKILILITLATLTVVAANAQTDSLPPIPLYDNVVSDDAPDADESSPRQTINPFERRKDSKNNAAPQRHMPNSVGEQLRILSNLYSAGKYNDALALSDSILQNHKLTKEENIYRQVHTIAAFKDLEYNEEADSVTKLFHQKYPFYKPASYDPVSFKENLGNYYTMPRFSVWIGAGPAGGMPQIDTVHVITDTLNREPSYDPAEVSGFVFQLGFEYHICKWLSIAVAPTYMRYQYGREIERGMMTTFRYEETDNILTLPMYLAASLYTKREIWVPSIYFGAKAKYITKAKYAAYTQTIGQAQYTASTRSLDLDDKNQSNFALMGGMKLNYNYRRATFFADAGLSYDLKPFNKPGRGLSNSDLLYDKMFIPDSFHMMDLTFVVGVKINFFYKTVARFGYGY